MANIKINIPYISKFYPLEETISVRTEAVTVSAISLPFDGGVGDVPNPVRLVTFARPSGEFREPINSDLLNSYAAQRGLTADQLVGQQVTVLYDTKDPRPEFHQFKGIVRGLEKVVIEEF